VRREDEPVSEEAYDAKPRVVRFTVRGLAEHFGVSVRTVRLWIDEGKINAIKDPGRWRWIILMTEKEISRDSADSADIA
jgi:excisionase family DNA binding protein